MRKGQQVVVIDTNVLVDYPDIVPEMGVPYKPPKNATVDLTNANIVIPTVVVQELSEFKRERNHRGRAASRVLRALRADVEPLPMRMRWAYNGAGVPLEKQDMTLSTLPVHAHFCDALPFRPQSDDMDGQIILAALAAKLIANGEKIPMFINKRRARRICEQLANDDLLKVPVTLLTNDNGLAIRATDHGILTKRYGHSLPRPYTGRREVTVPNSLLFYFFSEGKIERYNWESEMENAGEPPLVANEFIVMHPEDAEAFSEWYRAEEDDKFDYVGRYDVKQDAIVPLEYIKDKNLPIIPRNVGQAIYIEALMNPKFAAVICTGPAGSGKTYVATVYGYYACQRGEYISVAVVPCATESKIGAMPGDLDSKMDLDVQPMKNALRNYLLQSDRGLQLELQRLREFGARDVVEQILSAKGVPENAQRSIKQKLTDCVNGIWSYWFSNIPIAHPEVPYQNRQSSADVEAPKAGPA